MEFAQEFAKIFLQKWLDDNNILMHFSHNEGKPVAVERFVRILKAKIYKK